MKKLLLTMYIGLAFFASVNSANATVLTFEGLNTYDPEWVDSAPIPDGYGSLNWDNVGVLDSTTKSGTGYNTVVESPVNVAFNGFGNPATIYSSTDFVFNGAFMAAAWTNGQTFIWEGYNDGSLLYTTTFSLNTYTKEWKQFDWTVDKLVFKCECGDDWLAMDNFTFNEAPAPEPSTMLLGLLGLAGASGLRKRK